MGKYRKKPIVVEAFQMTRERRYDNSEWPEWLHRAWNEPQGKGAVYCIDGGETLFIGTLEGGSAEVTWGDWIIRGIAGELYPCNLDIFEQTYDKVDDAYRNARVREIVNEAINDHFAKHLEAFHDPPTTKQDGVWVKLGDEKLLSEIRLALADPSAPWYGSELVPLVADLCEAHEKTKAAICEFFSLLEARVSALQAEHAEKYCEARKYLRQLAGIEEP